MTPFPVPIPTNSHFPIENIPFGIFSTVSSSKRAGTAIGDFVVDLSLLERHGLFRSVSNSFGDVFAQATLNKFASLPQEQRRQTRDVIIDLLSTETSELFVNVELNTGAFIKAEDVEMHLPMSITEFTDFSTAEEHVGNCFAMSGLTFPPDGNFYFSPMAYTGRCSSIKPSPKPIHRPSGMYKATPNSLPQYQPTQKLDYELEIAFFVSNPVSEGATVTPDSAQEHIFGFVLLNDWSARDIQMYESLPVGPLNSKAFSTTVSPWVVVPEALADSRAEPRNQSSRQDQIPSHIKHADLTKTTYDITCHAFLQRKGNKESKRVSTSNTKHMFYSPGQLLAHRASTGCGMPTGELIGLGTVSSPEDEWPDRSVERRGCLFEITNDGKEEIKVNKIGGKWLADGDEVKLEAWANGKNGVSIGFGPVIGKVLPAIQTAVENGI